MLLSFANLHQVTLHINLGEDCAPLCAYKAAIRIMKLFGSFRVAGLDGIPPLVIKNCSEHWAYLFTPLINWCLRYRSIPPPWQGLVLVPVFKKGNPISPLSYQLLAVLDMSSKSMSKYLLEPLSLWSTAAKIIHYSLFAGLFCSREVS